jgi:hypothetical protein
MAASPTPPHPNTATESPRPTGDHRCAQPGHDAAAQQACHLGLGGRVDGRALARGDERQLRERADAEGGRERLARRRQRHLLLGVVGGEAVPRPSPQAGPAAAADGPPVQDDEVAGPGDVDVGPDRLHDPRRLVAEEEREVIVDGALAIVQVGVAHAARLHPHQRLARPRVGHDDGLDPDRPALLLRHDSSDFVRHRPPP